MRAIGFRAFVKRKKKMLPVTDLCFNETEAVGVSGCGNAKCTLCVDWYSFDDVVLMQYTGLKDKNGKKIFEGDIGWDEHNECYGVVKFEEGKFLYVWENIAEDLWEVADGIEICGNIHENPELLEVSE
ncbi:YopX family protein [Listeria monocytogenes]|uniref:YopX family protein n=1 Tax=Listeria monocytogenes TaxID=1639 RepID=UPI00313D6919